MDLATQVSFLSSARAALAEWRGHEVGCEEFWKEGEVGSVVCECKPSISTCWSPSSSAQVVRGKVRNAELM